MKTSMLPIILLASIAMLGCRPNLNLEGEFRLDPTDVYVELEKPGTEAYQQARERLQEVLKEENQIRQVTIQKNHVHIRFDKGDEYDGKLEVFQDEGGRIFSFVKIGDNGELNLSLVKLTPDAFALDGIIFRRVDTADRTTSSP